jgi:hypothetical protein
METESGPEHPSLSEMGERVRKDFDLIRDVMGRERDHWRERLVHFVDEHPLGAVGAAFGVGFVLSGGLFSRTTMRTLKLGTRLLLGSFINQALLGAGLGMLTPDEMREPQARR